MSPSQCDVVNLSVSRCQPLSVTLSTSQCHNVTFSASQTYCLYHYKIKVKNRPFFVKYTSAGRSSILQLAGQVYLSKNVSEPLSESRIRQLVLFWHDDGADDISEQPGEAGREQGGANPEQTNQRGISVKVFSKSPAYAAEFFVGHRTIQFLLFHFVFVFCFAFAKRGLWVQKYMLFPYPERGKRVFFLSEKFVISFFNALNISYHVMK